MIRFGGIQDQWVEPWELLRHSLEGTGWRVRNRRSAGSARTGRRQADCFFGRRAIHWLSMTSGQQGNSALWDVHRAAKVAVEIWLAANNI